MYLLYTGDATIRTLVRFLLLSEDLLERFMLTSIPADIGFTRKEVTEAIQQGHRQKEKSDRGTSFSPLYVRKLFFFFSLSVLLLNS